MKKPPMIALKRVKTLPATMLELERDDEQKVGRAARDDERRHDDDLQQRGDEDHRECAQ